jgi:hypothetical protein
VGLRRARDDAGFDQADALQRLREALPAALVPLLAVVDTLPTRTSGKVDRAALPWPLPGVGTAATADELTATEEWLAERLGRDARRTPASGPDADFFAAAAAASPPPSWSRWIRDRYPRGSVSDIYQHPRLSRSRRCSTRCAARPPPRAPTARPAPGVQTLLMLPLLTLVGLRWVTVLAALGNVLHLAGSALGARRLLVVDRAGLAAAVQPAGPDRDRRRAGARLLLRGVRRAPTRAAAASTCGCGRPSGSPN